MKKIIMIALMAIVTCTAEAQNTLRENGTLTLQPKIGAGFGYLSGKFEMEPGGQRRIRTGIVLGVEGEYYDCNQRKYFHNLDAKFSDTK